MNSKERVMTAVSHKSPDRVPIMCGRIDQLDYFLQFSGCKSEAELRALWGLDVLKTTYSGVFKTLPNRTIWDTDGDWDKGYNSAKIAPLKDAKTIKDIEDHNWPTLENVDFELFKKRNDALEDGYAKVLSLGFQPIFGTLNDLFGMEESMVLMYTYPKLIEAAIERIEGFLLEEIEKALKVSGKGMDFFWLGDDFSTQRGLMIAPEMWRKFLKSTYEKLFSLVKSYGLKVWFHSCGSFELVRPDLIDIGIDLWETVQAHLVGNEPERLKAEFGKHVSFFGGINCQQTLSFGTEQDVRAEVRERIRVLGEDGGYILGPDHSIQGNMPAENVFAMFDEAKKILY